MKVVLIGSNDVERSSGGTGCGTRGSTRTSRADTTITMAPAATTHFVCCRSTGPDVRAYRYTSAARPPTRPTSINGPIGSGGSLNEPFKRKLPTAIAAIRTNTGTRVHLGTNVPLGKRN